MNTTIKLERAKSAASLPNDQVDINDLADIRDVNVDPNLPYEERLRSYIEQIKNPYMYRCASASYASSSPVTARLRSAWRIASNTSPRQKSRKNLTGIAVSIDSHRRRKERTA